jgi:hypothetical protein
VADNRVRTSSTFAVWQILKRCPGERGQCVYHPGRPPKIASITLKQLSDEIGRIRLNHGSMLGGNGEAFPKRSF